MIYHIPYRFIIQKEVAIEKRHKKFLEKLLFLFYWKKQRSCSKRAGGEISKPLRNLTRKEVSHA
jgi:hypothetical protein